MPSCIVENCDSHWRKKEVNVIFHVFPKDKARIKQWLEKTGQFNESNINEAVFRVWVGKATDSYRLCSKHFSLDMYQNVGGRLSLKKDAFPSIFQSPQTLSDLSDDEEDKVKRLCTEHNRDPTSSLSDRSSCLVADRNKGPSLHSPSSSAPAEISSISSSVDPMLGVIESSHVQDNSLLSFFRSKKRHRSTKGVNTDFPRETKNKKIGTYPFQGTKNKRIQRSPVTTNVGIQCNLFRRLKTKKGASAPQKMIHSPLKEENLEGLLSDGTHDVASSSALGSQLEESSFQIDIEIDGNDFSYSPSIESSSETEDSDSGTPRVDSKQTTPPSPVSGSERGRERKFLIFESCLDHLLTMVRCTSNRCNASLAEVKKSLSGSCMSVSATCRNGHRALLWESQPKIKNAPVGDVLISSAALCSGSSFQKIERFLQLLGMVSISKAVFYECQKKMLFPAIDYHWKLNQQNVISQLSGRAVCLAGDGQRDGQRDGQLAGQRDGPRDNAKYCTYSFMEAETQQIVGFCVEQLTPGSSSLRALESKALVKVLDEVQQKGLHVRMLSTDRHVTIRKTIREKYPKILHRYDVRHMAKSIGAKLNAATKKKRCEELAPWIPSIKKHLWWASANCKRDPTVLKEQWCSLLLHVINVHRWDGGEHYKACHHLPIRETSKLSKNWLRDGSSSYNELKEIVLRKTWLRDLERMSLYGHTSHLEIFRSTALKYKPKRNRFSMGAMVARTQLAILEHNYNAGGTKSGPSKTDPSGSYGSRYSKARGQRVFGVVYEPHRQDFVYNIYNHIFDALQR